MSRCAADEPLRRPGGVVGEPGATLVSPTVGRSARRAPFGRREWLTPIAVLGALTLVAVGAGTAQAQTLPSGPAPLQGSNFQGGDGNQDNAPPLVDWQGLQASPGRVVHNPDGGLQFGPGDKEDKPGEWTLIPEHGADDSPGTLDPGDTWTYGCSNKTQAPGAKCAVSTVKNTVTVTGGDGGTSVSDDDSLITRSTARLCRRSRQSGRGRRPAVGGV